MGIWRPEPLVLDIVKRLLLSRKKGEKRLPLSPLRKRAALFSLLQAGRSH
jgi:hypothetical protein